MGRAATIHGAARSIQNPDDKKDRSGLLRCPVRILWPVQGCS